MKLLFIGGTGLISSACSDLALKRGMELYILNRGMSTKYPFPEGAHPLVGDVHQDESEIAALLADHHFDAVVDWIAFTPADIERDPKIRRKYHTHFKISCLQKRRDTVLRPATHVLPAMK